MEERKQTQEKVLRPKSGWGMLLVSAVIVACGILLCVFSSRPGTDALLILMVAAGIVLSIVGAVMFGGLKTVNPNEALVLTLFGKYHGTIKTEGFFWVNPFCSAFNPASGALVGLGKKISLKAMTLNNEKQKVNDEEGNPIEIGVVVIWKVVDTARAVFDVDNYVSYISTQCDAAIRQVARQYPYDVSENGDEKSLRGSSVEIHRDRGSAHRTPRLCSGNSGRHAAEAAGFRHHRRTAEDRRRRGEHGRDGAQKIERKRCGTA